VAQHKPIDPQIIADMMDQGMSRNEIARRLDRARSNIQMYVSRIQRERAAAGAPHTKIIPEGFHLSSVATTVDTDGRVRSQSYRAKSGEEGDVVPDSGSFPAPEGMYVRSVSTLVDGQTGAVKQQWVKSDKLKEDQFAAMVDASLRAAERVTPRDFVPPPALFDADLCTLYTITDYHFGMLAWGRETGAAWDLRIARSVLLNTFRAMLASSPASAVGILNQLGDCLHFDGLKALTPEHGNLLDADSRYQKLVEVVVEVLCMIVDMMLEKHETVVIFMHEGNHDQAGSVWLRVLFARLFKDNPRVKVETSPLPYVVYRHGKTLLGFHHGHLSKNESLPLLFAAKFREDWGLATKTYIHTGHRHHVDEKEHPGAKVIQHSTLAAPDAHAARGGWLSERQATYMVYHRQRGEVARGIFLPEMDDAPTLH